MVGLRFSEALDGQEGVTVEFDDLQKRVISGALEGTQSLRRQLEFGEREVGGLVGIVIGFPLEQGQVGAELQPFAGPVEIDLPSDELRSEPDVLSVSADRQRQLILVDDRRDHLALLIAHHLRDPGRRKSPTRKNLRLGMPGNDVDALSAQLLNHSLNPRTPQPDTGADRIDRLVTAVDGDFGSATDFARNFLDVDDTLMDLRHLEVEERAHEDRGRPRQHQAGSLRSFFHLFEDTSDGVTLPETLARILFLPWNDGVGIGRPVEHHHDLTSLDLLDFARQELAHPIAVLLPNPVAFVLADPLHDALLHRHHSVSAKILKVDRNFHHVSDLETLIVPPGLFQADLRRRILNLFDHTTEYDNSQATRRVVDRDFGLHIGAMYPSQARHNAISQEVVHLLGRQALRSSDVVERGDNLASIDHNPLRSPQR